MTVPIPLSRQIDAVMRGVYGPPSELPPRVYMELHEFARALLASASPEQTAREALAEYDAVMEAEDRPLLAAFNAADKFIEAVRAALATLSQAPPAEKAGEPICSWCGGCGRWSDHVCRMCNGKGRGSVFVDAARREARRAEKAGEQGARVQLSGEDAKRMGLETCPVCDQGLHCQNCGCIRALASEAPAEAGSAPLVLPEPVSPEPTRLRQLWESFKDGLDPLRKDERESFARLDACIAALAGEPVSAEPTAVQLLRKFVQCVEDGEGWDHYPTNTNGRQWYDEAKAFLAGEQVSAPDSPEPTNRERFEIWWDSLTANARTLPDRKSMAWNGWVAAKPEPVSAPPPERMLAYELEGVITDVQRPGGSFDAVCLATLKRVRDALWSGEPESARPASPTSAEPLRAALQSVLRDIRTRTEPGLSYETIEQVLAALAGQPGNGK